MAKQGQHKNDGRGPRTGRNTPRASMTITTGAYKRHETYDEQARQHRDTDPQPQQSPPERSTKDRRNPGPGTRAYHPRSGRSGSDSNADRGTRGY